MLLLIACKVGVVQISCMGQKSLEACKHNWSCPVVSGVLWEHRQLLPWFSAQLAHCVSAKQCVCMFQPLVHTHRVHYLLVGRLLCVRV